MNRILPGDRNKEDQIRRMLRVNHAGEYGAQRIYEGQLAVLGKSECGPLIRHMAQQEEEHLRVFSGMVRDKRVRPTALMPLWHVAGYALGAATALLGKEAAMACTEAVEAVIDEHYATQEKALAGDNTGLRETISKFRADEKEHHDTAIEHGAKTAPAYGLLTKVVSQQTRLAIWLSTRI